MPGKLCRVGIYMYHKFSGLQAVLVNRYQFPYVFTTESHSHIYKNSCLSFLKKTFGPQHCAKIGLADGECLERLWSYLRKFGQMTKVMTPERRLLVLSEALAHYAQKSISGLGETFIRLFVSCFLFNYDSSISLRSRCTLL